MTISGLTEIMLARRNVMRVASSRRWSERLKLTV
jgi:hypothetical protein